MYGRRSERPLTYEDLEQRCLLSASAGIPVGDPATADVSVLAETAWLTAASTDRAGNSMADARNVGLLRGVQRFEDRVEWTDRHDVYRFAVGVSSQIDIRVDGLTGDADLYLFDGRGRLLAFSNRGGRRAEAISTQLDAGTYHVLVSSYAAAATPYQLTLSGSATQPTVPDEAGDGLRTARDLGPLTGPLAIDGTVGNDDRADFYKFHVARTTQIDVQLTGLRDDIDLYVYDVAGRLLGRSARGGEGDDHLAGQVVAGTYYVGLIPYSGAASPYQLIVASNVPAARPPADSRPPATSDPPATSTPVARPAPTPSPVPPTVPPTTPQRLPDVPYYGDTNDWNVNLVGAPEAWANGITGDGVVVAVVDTGVDLNHSDIVSSLWTNPGETPGDRIDNDGNGFVDDVFGWDFVNQDNQPDDLNGHGTHVAGTIAAARNGQGATGLAYEAEIMPVRVLNASGAGSSLTVAAGIRYAVDNGADIVNLSLGGGYSSVIDAALQYAAEHDVFVTIASGNSSAQAPAFPAIESRGLDNVLSVGAIDRHQQRATFSNRVGGSGAIQIDAPGVNIYSALPGNGYGRLSGTSMAAPHVAGVAALVLSAQGDLSAAQLRTILTQTADLPVTGSDARGGLDAARAVALALATSPAGPSAIQTDPAVVPGRSQVGVAAAAKTAAYQTATTVNATLVDRFFRDMA